MAPSLERLRLLHAAGIAGSIAAAARDVGYTPSAVSQQLSALERDVGATLLERSNRGITLTAAGLLLAERASIILDLVDAAVVEAADEFRADAQTTIRIGAFPTAVTELILPARVRLGDNIRLMIVDLEPGDALRALLARTLDAAVVDRYDNQPDVAPTSLHHTALLIEPLRLITRTRRPVPDSFAALATAEWVLGSEDTRLGRATRAVCHAAGFEPRVIAETDDHRVAFDIVRATGAVTVQPALTMAERPARIVALRFDLGCQRHIELVTRKLPRSRPASRLTPLETVSAALLQVVAERH